MTEYTNETSPIDKVLLIIGQKTEPGALQDWALGQAPLLASLTSSERERVNLALIRAGVPRTFVDKNLARVIRDEMGKHTSGDGSDGRLKQADKLLEIVRERTRFFTGADGDLYASVKAENHTECYRLNSAPFTSYLSHVFYTETGTVIGAQARSDAKSVMAFLCTERQEPVFVRMAGHLGKVYVDRGTPDWSAIEIDGDGWRIVENPPVNFRRTPAMGALATPVKGGSISELALFVNVDEDQWPLVVAFAIACLFPTGPYPILLLSGEQGSAKSTTLRVLKRLIDPSAAELRRQPTDLRDLMIAANNSWFCVFDNVSQVSNEVCDTMCVISTGGGFSRKMNYTDSDETILDVMRPQAINGIGDFASRGDLLDRAIVITPPVIPEERREDERSFWGRFDAAKPALLGALLNCVSMALRNLDTTVIKAKPRMADFARLAVAAEPAYNAAGAMSFLDLYLDNRAQSTASILETSPLARVLWELIKTDHRWIGSSRLLFTELTKLAADADKRSPGWPVAENRVKTAIQRIAPALRRVGIDAFYHRTKINRGWEITYTKPAAESAEIQPELS